RPSAPPITNTVGSPSSAANCLVVRSLPRSSRATMRDRGGILRFFAFTSRISTSYPLGMRRTYPSRAIFAQGGRLLATATTCSLATSGLLLWCRATLRLCRLLHLHFLAAPEFFQVVVAAHRRVHDVDHDVAQVHQHPFAVAPPFDAHHRRAQRLQFLLHVRGERVHLPVGVAARDHDALEIGGLRGDVEHHDVAPLDVLERFDHGSLLHAYVHQAYRPFSLMYPSTAAGSIAATSSPRARRARMSLAETGMGIMGMVFTFSRIAEPDLATTAMSQSFSSSGQRCQELRFAYWSAPISSVMFASGDSSFSAFTVSKVNPLAPGRSSRSSTV